MTIIAAVSENGVIGTEGKLPWHIPEEYEHFLKVIAGKTVIIGRTSFDIFGPTLTSAHTIVVSHSRASLPNARVANSIERAVLIAGSFGQSVYIAGGTEIYKQMIPLADRMLLSFVKGDYIGDAHFPHIGPEWRTVRIEDKTTYTLVEYRRDSNCALV